MADPDPKPPSEPMISATPAASHASGSQRLTNPGPAASARWASPTLHHALRDLLCDLSRRALLQPGELQRDVRRVIAVLRIAGTLQRDGSAGDLRELAGQSCDGSGRSEDCSRAYPAIVFGDRGAAARISRRAVRLRSHRVPNHCSRCRTRFRRCPFRSLRCPIRCRCPSRASARTTSARVASPRRDAAARRASGPIVAGAAAVGASAAGAADFGRRVVGRR